MESSTRNSVYRFQDFVLNVSCRKLNDPQGEAIKLNARAFDLLVELLIHRGEVVPKKLLLDTVWSDVIVEENNINQAISILRKALGAASDGTTFIQTIPGRGYCFIAPVEVDEPLTEQADATDFSPTLPTVVSSANPFILTMRDRKWSFNSYTFAGLAASLLIAIVCLLLLQTSEPAMQANQHSVAQDQLAHAIPAKKVTRNIIPNSIVVMPFSHLNPDPDTELFVAGLHDELINQLAKVNGLKVISRDTVVRLTEDGVSTADIAGILRVKSLMTGTVLVQDDIARINLNMMDASTGVVLWSASHEADTRDFSGRLAMQNHIALEVAKALEVEIKPLESAKMATLPTSSFKAYRYLLAARNSYKHQDNKEKWHLVKKAIELDPNYADAHLFFASLNSTLSTTPLVGFTAEAHAQLMLESVDAFIRLEPTRTEGYALKAVALGIKNDWEGVAAQISILDDMGASLAERKYLAVPLMTLGDFKNAIAIYQESLITEPVNLYSRGLLMAAHEMVGNREQAREEYALGNELKSAWWGDSVNILLSLGRREPLTGLDELTDISPELLYVFHHVNDADLVKRSVLDHLKKGDKSSAEHVYYSALAAYYGDQVSANALLRMAMTDVSTSILWAWLPVFDQIRLTQGFRDILVDFGLVRYWQRHGWPEFCQPKDDSFECH